MVTALAVQIQPASMEDLLVVDICPFTVQKYAHATLCLGRLRRVLAIEKRLEELVRVEIWDGLDLQVHDAEAPRLQSAALEDNH